MRMQNGDNYDKNWKKLLSICLVWEQSCSSQIIINKDLEKKALYLHVNSKTLVEVGCKKEKVTDVSSIERQCHSCYFQCLELLQRNPPIVKQ